MAKKSSGMSFTDAMNAYSTKKDLRTVKLSVDALNDLWGGGITLGFMYSLWAEPGCGKTTLALQCAKSFCRQGLKVLIVDVEKAINDFMIESFGLRSFIDDGLLIILTVTDFEEWENLCDSLLDQNLSLVITDSVTAISPVTPDGLHVTDVRPGLRAQQESFVLNKIKSSFYKKEIAHIVIFHARANINITGRGTQPDVKQAGGFAAGHYPDVVTRISSHAKIEGDEKGSYIGVNIRLVTTKNKFTSPNRVLEKKLIYGVGISKKIDLVDTAIDLGLIIQKGSYFDIPNGDRIKGRRALYELPADTLKMLQESIQKQQ
jgi:RecA/RadA recombinase